MLRLLPLACIAFCLTESTSVAQPPPPLPETPFEPQDLIRGDSLDGWTNRSGGPPSDQWVVEEGGVLHRAGRGGDIITEAEFEHFDFTFEFKIAPGGNSGIKYRLCERGGGLVGLEYQVLDDKGNKEKNSCGSLYALYAPSDDKPEVNPDEWQTGRIVSRGRFVEHWLNGVKVVEAEVGSDDWQERVAKSKFKKRRRFGEDRKTRILLQDHGNEVWFRNLRVVPAE